MIFLIYVLFLHWVGDFVCQTQWMADKKGHDFSALATHVSTYATVLAAGILLTGRFSADLVLDFFLVNWHLHLATDFVTSKVASYFHKQGKTKAFFTAIGFDQFIHAATLVLTTKFLLGHP